MSGCTGGLLSGGPNTCHCSCRDLKSAATVVADEFGHLADSPGRVAAGADTSADSSITVAEHPCVHRPSSRWPGIGYPGDLTLMGAHNQLCAHSQLRLVVSADNWQVSMVSSER